MKKVLIELNVIFTKGQKIQLFFLAVLILGGAFCELLGVSAIMPLIASITDPDSLADKWYIIFLNRFFHFQSSHQIIVCMVVVMITIYILKNLYLCVMSYFQYRFTYTNQYKLSQRMLANYLNRPYSFHLQHSSAELIRNIKDDTEGCYSFVLCVLQLLTEMVVSVVLIIYLLIQDKSITIGIALLLGLYVLLYAAIMKKRMRVLGSREREQFGKMNKWIMEAMGGIKETKVLQREPFFESKFKNDTEILAKTRVNSSILTYTAKPIVETICISGMLLIILLKLSRGVAMSYFIPIISLFAVAAFRLLPSVNRMTTSIGMILTRKPNVDALYQDLVSMTYDARMVDKIDELNNKLDFKEKIEITNLSFRYDGMEEDVLTNINLTIPKNHSVAIIGQSGGGKTTLADLILGVLTPQKGEIRIDEKNISNNMSGWYAMLGYIPQTIFLLDDSIKSNIAFGIANAQIDEERLKNAVREAQLEEFVKSLPEGLNTMVGERGVRLSGGQRQRIGIARALYNDPEILVLDEATSALDNDTENAIMEAIDSLGGKKTLIIIAHRLTTIKNCDLVYQVGNKTVVRVEK